MNKKLIGLMKNELGGKIMEAFVVLRPKTYNYLTDDNDKNKAKGTEKCVIKQLFEFKDYKTCLETV